jgi:hypothetical protein
MGENAKKLRLGVAMSVSGGQVRASFMRPKNSVTLFVSKSDA